MKQLIIECEAEGPSNIVTLWMVAKLVGVKITRVSRVSHVDLEDEVMLSLESPEARAAADKIARRAALQMLTNHDFWPIKDCVAPRFENKADAVPYIGFLAGKAYTKMSEITASDLGFAHDELCGIESALRDWNQAIGTERNYEADWNDTAIFSDLLGTIVHSAYWRPLLSHDEIRRATREFVRRQYSPGGNGEALHHNKANYTGPPGLTGSGTEDISRKSGPPPVNPAPSGGSAIRAIIDQGKAQARGLAPGRPVEHPPVPLEAPAAPITADRSLFDSRNIPGIDMIEEFFNET